MGTGLITVTRYTVKIIMILNFLAYYYDYVRAICRRPNNNNGDDYTKILLIKILVTHLLKINE